MFDLQISESEDIRDRQNGKDPNRVDLLDQLHDRVDPLTDHLVDLLGGECLLAKRSSGALRSGRNGYSTDIVVSHNVLHAPAMPTI